MHSLREKLVSWHCHVCQACDTIVLANLRHNNYWVIGKKHTLMLEWRALYSQIQNEMLSSLQVPVKLLWHLARNLPITYLGDDRVCMLTPCIVTANLDEDLSGHLYETDCWCYVRGNLVFDLAFCNARVEWYRLWHPMPQIRPGIVKQKKSQTQPLLIAN